MNKALSFNDVLLVPGFSTIASRKDVDLSVEFMGEKLTLPVLSAPMDTVTSPELAIALHKAGGLATLHRFQPIQDNIDQFKKVYIESNRKPIVSVGLQDYERMEALYDAGAVNFLLDVAHGAQQSVVNWTKESLNLHKDINVMIGNFSTERQIIEMSKAGLADYMALRKHRITFRIGIGGGSACTTRLKTGCGQPTLSSIMELKTLRSPLIADGGIKTPGDIAKALAAGASVVMLGGMLAGTDESPGELVDTTKLPIRREHFNGHLKWFKVFRGSAATSSYKDQGKEWATAEGEEFLVKYKGSVTDVLKDIEGGLRSSLTYIGAATLTEFRERATFVEITNAGIVESGAHGKAKY